MPEETPQLPTASPSPQPPAASAPAPEVGLTQETAQKILKRDIANMVKKVAGGRTLSATERAMIQAAADGEAAAVKAIAWAMNQAELAQALGVTRMSVNRWRKEGAPPPESDGRWNVTVWREWMKAHGKKSGVEDNTPSKVQLEAKRLLLQNEKLETEIGILRGDYTRNVEIEAHIRSMVAESRKAGEQMPASLAPQLAGLTVPEIEKRLRAWWDDFCLQLHTGTPQKR